MEFKQDYYALLGIPDDADDRTIKRAYRRLARIYHPDISVEPQAAERFQQIQEAYQILLNPIQRQAFDHWRRRQGLEQSHPLILRVIPSHEELPCLDEPQALYLLVEIATSNQGERSRPPLNLCLVLDRSTSMKGARLHQVKEAARSIVDQLASDDVLSIVTFSDRAEVVLPGSQHMDKTAAKIAIGGIRSEGGTEIFQGLQLGLDQVGRWHGPGTLSHLILITDGQTYGDEEQCLGVARLAGERGIPITTMGIGSDWNTKLLDEIANLSKAPGSSIYLDSTAKIQEVFRDRVQSLNNTVVRDLSLSIHWGQGVTVKELFRVSPEITELFLVDDRVTLGLLEVGNPQIVIIELLVGTHTPGSHQLVRVAAQGIMPSTNNQAVYVERNIETRFVANLGQRKSIPSDIVSAMGKLTIFKMQQRVTHEVETGRIESAIYRLKAIATRLLDIGETELAQVALLEAGRLAQTGSFSSEGQKKLYYGTRGLGILPKKRP